MGRFIIPLAVFIVLVGFLAVGLSLNPKVVPSPFIGKDAPNFTLPRLHEEGTTLSRSDMLGKVWLLNVWASWCASCRVEHAIITELSRSTSAEMVGLNYKDNNEDARSWLERWGNPYRYSAVDIDGRVGLDWGVYGVPETFVIDKSGIVRHKHIGPMDRTAMEETVLPLLKSLIEEEV